MKSGVELELIQVSQKLLNAIAASDWNAYAVLCDDSITCFEAEARGQLVEGLTFHKYYFDLPKGGTAKLNTITSPHVRVMGNEAAIISYVRLVQCLDSNGAPQTLKFEETRVWQRKNGQWKHVHFHRSGNN